jgi:nucleotide-binding universal stress UspA family protein
MKKILVPIDFSTRSEYALKVGATLAKRHDVGLVVLHMLGLSPAILTKDDSQEAMEAMYYMKLAEKRFNEFLDRDYLKGIKIESTVQNYKLFHEIDDVAKEFGCDLIVMGSHGTSGFKEVFVGSNTERVVRSSEIPVLVIKHEEENFRAETVVFANNFDKKSVRAFLKAKKFFDATSTQMKLVYINTPGDGFRSSQEMEERVMEFLYEANVSDQYDLNDVAYYNAYSIEEGIFAYSNKIHADLICIPTHGRQGLAHFFSGSISEDLVNHSELPVLTIKM